MQHFIVVLLALVASSLAAQSTPLPQAEAPVRVDSGWHGNPGPTPRVVFRHTFKVAGAPWVQIRTGAATNLPAGTILRISGAQDGVHQIHSAASLRDYQQWSAAFNGERVTLEMIAAPRTTGNRVTVDLLLRGLPPTGGIARICGTTDDRVPSNDPRVGRKNACTAFLAGKLPARDADLMISAQFCTSSPFLLELNVPPSQANGWITRSAPQDQYPYTVFRSGRGGLGASASWMVCSVHRNSTTRKLPTEANGGQFFDLGAIPANIQGETVEMMGYGSTNPPGPRSYTQQKGTGPMMPPPMRSVISYSVDTSGGLGGAPVVRQRTGKVIAIHGYVGCSATGGANHGTRIDNADLQQALSDIRLTPAIYSTYGQGCPGSARAPNECVALNPRGGTSTNVLAGGGLAYAAQTKRELRVTAISVFASATQPIPVVVSIREADRNGNPGRQLTPGFLAVFNPTPAFRRVSFNPITIPSGKFFVWVADPARVMHASSLTAGDAGTALQYVNGTWQTSPAVQRPSFRVHCVGDGQANTPPKIGNTGRPLIGQSISIHLVDARPQAPCALMFGISSTTWAGGALPWSLAPIGAPGCDLLQSYDVTLPGLMTNATGAVTIAATIPNQQSLLGLTTHCQWYVVDPGQNAAGLSVTRGLRAVLGNY